MGLRNPSEAQDTVSHVLVDVCQQGLAEGRSERSPDL